MSSLLLFPSVCAAAVGGLCASASSPDFNADPHAQWGVLPNGMRYVLYPNQTPRKVVAMRLYIASGSLQETDAQQGLAHFLEHMAFNGTRHFPAGEMVEYFQRIGMAFGSDTNAHTGFDETVYKLNLPDASPKTVADSLTLLRDYADGMTIDPKEVDRERGVILSEKRTRDTVDYRQFEDYYTFQFAGHQLANRLPIGKEDVIRHAPAQALRDYYETWYRPDRMLLVVTGDFDAPAMRADIEKTFSTPLEGKTKETPAPDFGKLSEGGPLRVRFFPEPKAEAVSISFGAMRAYGAGQLPAADSFARRSYLLKLDAALRILQSRIKQRMQQEDTPVSDAAAYRWPLPAHTGEMLALGLECKPENWKPALELADTELRRALRYGFTPDEIAQARAELDNAYRTAAEKASTRTSDAIADGLIRSVSAEETFMHPAEKYARMKPVIESLSEDDLFYSLRAFWNGADHTLHMSGPLDMTAQAGEQSIRTVLEAASKQPLEMPKERAQSAFAYADWGTPGAVSQQRAHEKIDVTQIQFANNVRLNFKRTDFEANNILVLVRVGDGRLGTIEQSLIPLAQEAFLKGGLKKHAYTELERLMALNGMRNNLTFQCAEDAFVFRVQTEPQTLRFALDCITAYLTDAAYSPEAQGRARQSIEGAYRKARYTMEGTIGDQVSRYLADGSPYFGLPPEKEALASTMADLERWMRPQFAQGYLEISIVGDCDETAALDTVASTLGALPMRQTKKPLLKTATEIRFPAPGEKDFFYEGDLPRAASLVVWPTCDAWDTEKVRALNVLGEIFSDRLRLRVRQALGEAYSPYAYNRSSETFTGRGLFQAVAVLKPESVPAIEEQVEKIAHELYDDGITAGDEFDRAVAPFRTVVQTQLRKNTYWLDGVLARSWEHPELLERPLTLEKGYLEMKPEAVAAVAREYLFPQKAIRVRVLPQPSATQAE